MIGPIMALCVLLLIKHVFTYVLMSTDPNYLEPEGFANTDRFERARLFVQMKCALFAVLLPSSTGGAAVSFACTPTCYSGLPV